MLLFATPAAGGLPGGAASVWLVGVVGADPAVPSDAPAPWTAPFCCDLDGVWLFVDGVASAIRS